MNNPDLIDLRFWVERNPDLIAYNPELQEVLGSKTRRPSKYRNIRVVDLDGESYDSGKEAVDAKNFVLGVRGGEFIAYFHHVCFPLPGGIFYEADHLTINKDLSVSVYDSKGDDAVITKEYRLKKKLFKETYHQEIKEI